MTIERTDKAASLSRKTDWENEEISFRWGTEIKIYTQDFDF